jgi:hypothetical protein
MAGFCSARIESAKRRMRRSGSTREAQGKRACRARGAAIVAGAAPAVASEGVEMMAVDSDALV